MIQVKPRKDERHDQYSFSLRNNVYSLSKIYNVKIKEKTKNHSINVFLSAHLYFQFASLNMFFFTCLILIYLLLLENLVFEWTHLRSRSFQRGQPLFLGNLFLTFFFGLLPSLGQKVNIFCNLFLIFLSTLFLQSSTLMFMLQGIWSNKILNLGFFVLDFLLSFFAFLQHTGRPHLL